MARLFAGALLAMGLLGHAGPLRAEGEPAASDAEARAHFAKGDEHLKKGEYPEAYESFRKSLAAKRTRSTMAAVASALKQLGRYDEALTFYEQALSEFSSPPAAFAAKVGREIEELQKLVGTLSLSGDAPVGATLSVDNVMRAKLPLSAPLRVSLGTHELRVEKDGFDPITAKVDVVAGKESVVALVARSKKGRLVVHEKHGWPLALELDGKDVGVTPWEGLVEPGPHRLKLHGHLSEEALLACDVPVADLGETAEAARVGTKMESVTVTAKVRLYELTQVVLGAEDQDASLKVESAPRGAGVWIDAKEAGKTPWSGRLALGEHTIEVKARGFYPARQSVKLERRKQREVTVALEREPDLSAIERSAQRAKALRNVSTGVSYGLGAVALGVGGVTGVLTILKADDIRGQCGGPNCPRSNASEVELARRLSTVSTVGFVVGVLGAVAGTVTLLTLGPKEPEAKKAAAAPFQVKVGAGRLEIKGSF